MTFEHGLVREKKGVREEEHGEYTIRIDAQHFTDDRLLSFKAVILHNDAPFGHVKTINDYAHDYQIPIGLQYLLPGVRRPSSEERIAKLVGEAKRFLERRQGAMEMVPEVGE